MHSRYQDNTGCPARAMLDEDIAFGDPKNGVTLVLKNGITSAAFLRRIDGPGDPIYFPIHSRGNRSVDLEVDGIEICCEGKCFPESPDSLGDSITEYRVQASAIIR